MTSAEFAAHVLMAPTAPVRAAPGARKLLARGAGTTTTTINWLAAGKVGARQQWEAGVAADLLARVLACPPPRIRAAAASPTSSPHHLLLIRLLSSPTPPSFLPQQVLPTPGFAAQCGSSWAFAAADALASNLLISSRSGPQSLKAVSAQHIM